MKQLASKNIESVEVYIKGEENTITMPSARGQALMEYLLKDKIGSHVKITSADNSVMMVNRHDIKKIVPTYAMEKVNLADLEV